MFSTLDFIEARFDRSPCNDPSLGDYRTSGVLWRRWLFEVHSAMITCYQDEVCPWVLQIALPEFSKVLVQSDG